jgi:hypothetical protein
MVAYVRDLLARLSGSSPPTVVTLLPDAWLAAHPEVSPPLVARSQSHLA